MTASDELNEQLNVGGTRNALTLAADLEAGAFHQVSSVAASGDYSGTFDKLLKVFGYEDRLREAERLREAGRKVGVGLAACVEVCRPMCSYHGSLSYNQPQYASVTLRMHPDGSVTILSGDAP